MLTKRNLLISGIAFIAMVVVFIAALDRINDGDDGSKNVVVHTPRHIAPVAPQLTPAPAEETLASAASEPEGLVSDVPETPKEVTYEEAEAAFLDKRYADAVKLFAAYTEHKSENPWGHYMFGLSAWKAGDYEGAETAFARALELDQTHVKSYINLSRVLLDTGRPAEALDKIEDAMLIDPESNVAFRLRGRALAQLGKSEDAINAYRQAIRIDDQDAWSMNNMALIFVEEGRFDEALPPLARAVELRDDIAVFYNNLGMALEYTGHFRAAEQAYQTAVNLDKLYDNANANLDRVVAVTESPGLEVVDLAVIAQAFADEIESWRVAAIDSQVPQITEPETARVAVSEADSLDGGNEQ